MRLLVAYKNDEQTDPNWKCKCDVKTLDISMVVLDESIDEDNKKRKFQLMQMGATLPSLYMRDPPLRPHQQEGKFPVAHVCRVTFKHLSQPLKSRIQSFRILILNFLANMSKGWWGQKKRAKKAVNNV